MPSRAHPHFNWMHRSLSFLLLAAVSAAPVAAQTSLRGSPKSVDRMHRQALNHDVTFHRTPASVNKAHKAGTLVRLSGNRDFQMVHVNYPYVLPSTRTFVQRLAEQYRAQCGQQMVVTSGLRPGSFRLMNAHEKSVHPTGMAVDLRKPRQAKCLNWLRKGLLSLEGEGAIEATEERNPPHFHVAVYPRQYARYVAGHRGGGEVLAQRDSGENGDSGKGDSAKASSSAKSKSSGTAKGATRYRVRKGDNLSTIAKRHGTTVRRIRQANGLKSARLQPGQTLEIPTKR